MTFWNLAASDETVSFIEDVDCATYLPSNFNKLCAWWLVSGQFSLPRSLWSRVRPRYTRQTDVKTSDRQTSDRRQTKASLNISALWGRRHNNFYELWSNGNKKFISIMLCYRQSVIMRPSSLGGGRILRRTLSVRLSVCLSVCLSVGPSRYRASRRAT